jgi:hypothetical protein
MKNIIFTGLILSTTLITFSASSQEAQPSSEKIRPKIYAYDYWAYQTANDFLNLIDKNPTIQKITQDNAGGDLQCMPVFKNAIKNGVLDIRYALGYFDDSQGIDIMYDGFNYGLSPSLDIEVFHVLRRLLTAPCDTPTKQLCNFQESGDPATGLVTLSKNVNILGAQVLAQMTLTHASASESYEQNKGALVDLQKKLALQSEENYFENIGKSDVVIYNGHSRNGGGPDFNPPLLDKTLHVNYDGYYKVKKIGITRVLNQIKKNPNKDSVLGIFACYSQKHYYSSLMKANSKQRLVLSTDTIDYFDSLHASIGLLEGLLRGQCGDNLNSMIQLNEKLVKGYKAFQIK